MNSSPQNLHTLKSNVVAQKTNCLQQKTVEQVEKWRSELLYLDSSNIKIQEAIVIQNVIETALCKSIPLLCEIREALDKLLLLEISQYPNFIATLENISQLHDRHQTLTKLLLANWKFTSSEPHHSNQDNHSSTYVKYYYFPELGCTEQKIEVSIPNFEVPNPVLALINLMLAIKFKDQYVILLSNSKMKFLGTLVSKEQTICIQNLFYDESSFNIFPKTKITFPVFYQKKTFNSLYFHSFSSFPENLQAPAYYQFLNDYTIGMEITTTRGSNISLATVVIDWTLEQVGFQEVVEIFPITNSTCTFSSIGQHSSIGSSSINGEISFLEASCDLFYFPKSVYEWKYILPVLFVVSDTDNVSSVPHTLTLVSIDQKLNFTYRRSRQDSSCEMITTSFPKIFKIINWKMSVNDAWLSLVKGLSGFYTNLIKKYNVSVVKNKRDYSSIQFIAEMVTAQRKMKETNIELFTSLCK